jgi:hypothetical protein
LNYFAHGHRFLDEPYVLTGTALPDWLGAADRGARLRRERMNGNPDPRAHDLARGIDRHYRDDAWFHATEAFQRTSAEITALLREAEPDDPGFRAWFFGHVLVEMLLDRYLIREDRARLDRYYDALAEVDPLWLEETIRPWLTAPPSNLQRYIGLFADYRFLYGYLDDDGLARRLEGLARRVGLPPLPEVARSRIPEAARIVEPRVADLMREPCSPPD